MPRPRTMTPERLILLPGLVAQGKTNREIGRMWDVPEATIRYHLEKNGGKLRKAAQVGQIVNREELLNATLSLISDAVHTMREAVDQAKTTGKQAVIIRLGTREATQVLRALESRPLVQQQTNIVIGPSFDEQAEAFFTRLESLVGTVLTREQYRAVLGVAKG